MNERSIEVMRDAAHALRKSAEVAIAAALTVLEGAPRGEVWRVTVRGRTGYQVWTLTGSLVDVLVAHGKSCSGDLSDASIIVSVVREVA